MKAFTLLLTVGLVSSTVFAAKPIVTATDSMTVASTEVDTSEVSCWRITLSGVGQYGADLSMTSLSKKSSPLYGAGLDVMFNLLPEEKFNLWVGVGTTYMPEQNYGKFCYFEGDSTYTYTFTEKIKLESYDFRFMVVPEWKVMDNFALGLRLGAGVCHYSGEGAGTNAFVTTNGAVSDSWKYSYSKTTFRAIIGAQAHWDITDRLGALVYGQVNIGQDADVKMDGEKIGELDGISAEIGVGLSYSF